MALQTMAADRKHRNKVDVAGREGVLYMRGRCPARRAAGEIAGRKGAYRALCEKLAVLHHREFGKFRRLKRTSLNGCCSGRGYRGQNLGPWDPWQASDV